MKIVPFFFSSVNEHGVELRMYVPCMCMFDFQFFCLGVENIEFVLLGRVSTGLKTRPLPLLTKFVFRGFGACIALHLIS